MKTIQVNASSGHYAVVCGPGALKRLRGIVGNLRRVSEVFLVSSPKVWRHWGETILGKSREFTREHVIFFDDREPAKKLSTVEKICKKLAAARADRQALLVAVGGGVVGDVVGFAAASYMRGVRIVHVPTTLVAQVDSAIGGKTGVNLPEGKNLVGAFYPPEAVIADPLVLRSLPERQFRSGIYEVIKYAVIGDAELFKFLEERMEDVLRRDMRALEFVIERGVSEKARVVSQDERESGVRQTLNFGHTIGHALEALTRYRSFLHGEAVGWGMLGATRIAVLTKRLSERDAKRIASLVAKCGRLPQVPAISADALLQAIAGDKKSHRGRPGWVLPRKIGAVDFGVDVPHAMVADAWQELAEFHERARRGS